MNHLFFYDYLVDDEGRLIYVFWADGIFRKKTLFILRCVFILHNIQYKQVLYDICTIYMCKSSLSKCNLWSCIF